jgi:hypothetical protein
MRVIALCLFILVTQTVYGQDSGECVPVGSLYKGYTFKYEVFKCEVDAVNFATTHRGIISRGDGEFQVIYSDQIETPYVQYQCVGISE